MPKQKVLASVADLIKEGKENGFVTQDDILFLFPKPEDRIKELDELYGNLIRAGIDVFETTSQDIEKEASKSIQDLEKEIEALVRASAEGESVPVSMNHTEVGHISLHSCSFDLRLAMCY